MSDNTKPTILREISICGVELSTLVPATAEYFDALTAPGEAVAGAVTECVYRGYATAIRTKLGAAVSKEIGVEKADTDKTTAKGTPVKESDDNYLKRVKAEGLITQARVQELGVETERALPFITWLSQRGVSTGGTIGAEYLKIADGVLEAWANGTSTPEVFLAKVSTLLPGSTLSEEPTREDIAILVKRFKKAESDKAFV